MQTFQSVGTGYAEAPCPTLGPPAAQTGDVAGLFQPTFWLGVGGETAGREKETNSESQRGLKDVGDPVGEASPGLQSLPNPRLAGSLTPSRWVRPRCQEQKEEAPLELSL